MGFSTSRRARTRKLNLTPNPGSSPSETSESLKEGRHTRRRKIKTPFIETLETSPSRISDQVFPSHAGLTFQRWTGRPPFVFFTMGSLIR